MELKSLCVILCGFFALRFNRTFMELKYRYLKPIADHSFGLIVPLWN